MNKKMSFDGKKTSTNNKSIIIFVIILLLSVVSAVTLAFFAGSDYATKWTTTSGKVKIEAVGRGDVSIEDTANMSKLEIEFDRDYTVAIPNMPIKIYANCKIYKSSTKPLLRAMFAVNILDRGGNPLPEEQEGNIAENITSQMVSTILSKENWMFYDGYYYYVESEDGGNSILKEIDATARDRVIPFLNGEEITIPKDIEDELSGFSISIKIIFQAIQNYIPDDNGNKLTNTITNSQKIFSELSGNLYQSSPISWFDVTTSTDGSISLSAKSDVTYPEYLRLPEKTADGKTITNISSNLARGNATIKNIVIPSSYTTIDASAFRDSGLISVDMSESNITEIPDYAFYYSGLVSINLPSTLKKIGKYAFYNTKITSLVIPEGVEEAGLNFIGGSGSLLSVSFPSTLTTMVQPGYISNLKTIQLASGNTHFRLDDNRILVNLDTKKLILYAQRDTATHLQIPDDVEYSIFSSIISDATYLKTITLGKNLIDFNINLPNSVESVSIGENTNFSEMSDENGNTFITNTSKSEIYIINASSTSNTITIPDGVVSCSTNVLPSSRKDYITTLNLGKDFNYVTDARYSIYGCLNNLKTISIDSNNTKIKTISGNEILSYNGKIFCYLVKSFSGEYTIPDSVETLNYCAIYSHSNITKVYMSNNVNRIYQNFRDCLKLTEIQLSPNITNNGDYSFGILSKISSLNIYGTLGINCIQTCTSLKNVTISNCSYIGVNFLTGCKSLEWVEFTDTTPPTFSSQVMMQNNNDTFSIYVPDSSLEAYKTAPNLSIFADRIKPVSERG